MESKAENLKVVDILVREIFVDNDFNCRGAIAPIDVTDLAKSVKDVGLQQPITVQPYDKNPPFKYRVVMGHRRLIAFRINKAETIPAIIKEGLTEQQAKILNLIENLKRKDLNVLQEAKAIQNLRIAGYEETARLLGVSKGWVQIRFCLLNLPEEIQLAAAAGLISQSQIKEIHALPTRDLQYEAVRHIKDAKLRGEKKIKIKPQKTIGYYEEKNPRTRQEIEELQDVIFIALGNNLATRALAWAGGYINGLDMYRSIKEECDKQGKPFLIPTEIIRAGYK